jgi:hypothetical protein
MNKQRVSVPDYSSDNIFRASKQLANIALKEINKPQVISQPNITVPNAMPINPQPLPNMLSTPATALPDFMKGLKALNNTLDSFLTGLDNMFQEVPYPRINLQEKRNHNKRFEPRYIGRNYRNVGRGLAGGALTNDQLMVMSLNELKQYCDSHNIEVRGNRRLKTTFINSIIQHQENSPDDEAETIESSMHESGIHLNEDEEPLDFSGIGDSIGWLDSDTESVVDDVEPVIPHDDDESFDLRPVNLFADYEYDTSVGSEDDSGDGDYGSIQDAYENLALQDLKDIANAISNLQVQFSSYIKPIFNTLQQGKVDDIKNAINLLKPKIEELLQDSFIHIYHVPQANWIKDNFDKLYSSVIISVNSYVKSRVNGGGLSAGYKQS